MCVWVAGEEARCAEQESDDAVAEAVTRTLRRFTGDPSLPYPDCLLRSRWSSDPFFQVSDRSARSTLVPGGQSTPQASSRRRAPVTRLSSAGSRQLPGRRVQRGPAVRPERPATLDVPRDTAAHTALRGGSHVSGTLRHGARGSPQRPEGGREGLGPHQEAAPAATKRGLTNLRHCFIFSFHCSAHLSRRPVLPYAHGLRLGRKLLS